MELQLRDKDLLKLKGACGASIEVVEGRAWITEHGSTADVFLRAGGCYRVGGAGLVLVGVGPGTGSARILVRREAAPSVAELGEHLLRDVGLRRDQLPRAS